MVILFCSDPLDGRQPDPVYAGEASAAAEVGLSWELVSYEALVHEHDSRRAVRRVKERDPEETGVYRGWMLSPERYARLYEALLERGIRLVNSPTEYRYGHYLPEWYSTLSHCTPRTVWTEPGVQVKTDELMELLRPFGPAPVIVKDYVKSQKHYWNEACYIPSAADRGAVERIVARFLELQGDDLAEGLVFREWVALQPLGTTRAAGLPLTREYRRFYLNGELMFSSEYWETGDYGSDEPGAHLFAEEARAVWSRFFTMDVAQKTDGEWLVVELGDGQVAGLPEPAEPMAFFQALAAGLGASPGSSM